MLNRAFVLIAAFVFASSATAQEQPESTDILQTTMNMTEVERNQIFAGIVDSTEDHDCQKVTHSMIRGADDEKNIYVTVRCGDGTDYQLQLSHSRSGVMPCSVLTLIADVHCWEPLPEISN